MSGGDPRRGRSAPLGATITPEGVNFSVYSRMATGMELLLFDRDDDPRPARIIKLDPVLNRSYKYWHVLVPGLKAGQIYAWRADGPSDAERGYRFDRTRPLIDPYGRALAVPRGYDREALCGSGDVTAITFKSVVADPSRYDWGDDLPLARPFAKSVIYEMHVAGFTKHPSSKVAPARRGTYAGVIDKIPYLQSLGITAVELMPVQAFDVQDAPGGRRNYWGYTPVSYFAPHGEYSVSRDPLKVLDEFRDMVKALHRAGIEVILDVVYNHTAEGNHQGPTFGYRGFANRAYYLLDPADRSRYLNFSGTGNTLNANHPVVRRLIVDSLRYWVEEMHVDGFRFDLASILTRDEEGLPLKNPPILWDIETDPVLSGTKFIAEAWDAAGLYQVGAFIGDSWKEWNARFRDDVRQFVKSDPGACRSLAKRILGSPDLFSHEEQEPTQSVNFVTCHDGFTLNDLVSYDVKHNERNGEENRDGYDYNWSWNCGVEGPSDDPAVETLRERQIRNHLTLLFASLGTPMILMGDEIRRTQRGNNNAYNQDNETSWFDWAGVEKHQDLLEFVRRLIALRVSTGPLAPKSGKSLNQILQEASFRWHGVKPDRPDWGADSRILAVTIRHPGHQVDLHLIAN
ncbi:MAG TPA: glycogen debranching protein GlgX, partial [Planctomycetota bacterium]|nr:glycogen debranching protein GlgX [Planctomycetota bacterium]